ncbi:sulfite exporter TauE/SafE family protein [Maritimibacter fusiformis]|uniref:Probable membrane transporter protein n=2 Tax=Maritimibacter fusiformis TaxID=2603819 RepID=A0A5D0RKX4_9RHOB|nr:sulfite exporter TauE/SafE family protein [Maritimibacter fusiformis]TYB81819.1 sulfite exporter TauE/SafE family protein [Maritimibacter fusiformis]
MPDALAGALATPGLVWLIAAALIAGLVRGFAGFGSAMVFMPVAAQVLPPVSTLAVLLVMEFIGPLPHLPRALRVAHRGDILRLLAGMVVALPLGLWLLVSLPVELFRYGVSAVSLVMLVALAAGLRYRGTLRRWMVYATGALGGFLGGTTGLSGPPVILLYMASPHPAPTIRANLLLYLGGVVGVTLAMLGMSGRLEALAVVLGLMLAVPFLGANLIGGWLFDPDRERTYRTVAYIVIAVSALSGLPLFD